MGLLDEVVGWLPIYHPYRIPGKNSKPNITPQQSPTLAMFRSWGSSAGASRSGLPARTYDRRFSKFISDSSGRIYILSCKRAMFFEIAALSASDLASLRAVSKFSNALRLSVSVYKYPNKE